MSDTENKNTDFVMDEIDLSDPNLKGWDGVGGPLLPAGEYEVEILNLAMEGNKAGNGRNIVLELAVVTEGEHFDAKLKHWISMPSESHKDKGAAARKRVAHVFRDVLGLPLLPGGGFESKHAVGRRMIINVVTQTSKEYDAASNSEQTKVSTRIQGERPVEGAQVTQAPPPNAKPAQPAAKPGATPSRQPAAARPR